MKKLLSLSLLIFTVTVARAQFDPATMPYIFPSSVWLNQNVWLQATDSVSAGTAFGFNAVYAPTLNGNITNALMFGANGSGPNKYVTADFNNMILYDLYTPEIRHGRISWHNGDLSDDAGSSLNWINRLFFGQWAFDTLPTVNGSPVFTNGALLGSLAFLGSVTSNNVSGQINAGQIDGIFPIGNLPTNTMTVIAATNSTFSQDGSPLNGISSSFNGFAIISSAKGVSINRSATGNPGESEARDPSVVYARGLYYCFYTGTSASGGQSAVNLATSPTGIGGSWTLWGTVISTNRVNTNTFWSGNIISPSVAYNPATDDFWIAAGATTNWSAAAYNGSSPVGYSQIGLWHVAAGVSLTNGSANYQMMNNSNAISVVTGLEDVQGDYAPCLIFTNSTAISNGTISMYFNFRTNSVRAVSLVTFVLPPTPTTVVSATRLGAPALFAGKSFQAEEPDIIPIPNGGFVCLGAGDLTLIRGNVPCYYTTDPNGATNWYETQTLDLSDNVFTNCGSQATCKKPDGNWLLLNSALTNSAAARIITSQTIRFNTPVSLLVNVDKLQVGTLQVGVIPNSQYLGIANGDNSQDAINFLTNNVISGRPTTIADQTVTNLSPSGFGIGSGIESGVTIIGSYRNGALNLLDGTAGNNALRGWLGIGWNNGAGFDMTFRSATMLVTNTYGGYVFDGGGGNFSVTRMTMVGNGGGLTNFITSAMPYRSGLTNMPNLATAAAIVFAVPINPNAGTNYSVTFGEEGSFAATSFAYASAKTTNGFTLNLTTGITGGGIVTWSATPLTQTNGVSVGY